MNRFLSLIFAVGAVAFSAAGSPIVMLTLDPADGFLSGSPGSAVGWGYTLTTDSDYVLVSGLGFDDLTPVGTQNPWPPPATGASFGSPLIVPFIAGSSGLEYDIDPAAIPSSASTGGVFVLYDVYQDSTLQNQLSSGNLLYATDAGGNPINAEVMVSAQVLVSPEPGTLLLVGAGCLLLVWRRKRA